MIPDGYITFPEALRRIRELIDDDDLSMQAGAQADREACRQRAAIEALAEELGRISVLDANVMRGGTLRAIPREDMKQLIEEGWESWIESGRVEAAALKDMDHHEAWKARNVELATHRYHGCQPLLEEFRFRLRWKPPHDGKDDFGFLSRETSTVMRTGAPGRPSSMHLVMEEFDRRRTNCLCRTSREAESRDLAAWLKDEHPGAPPLSPKTICNNLPVNFQPYNAGKSKTPPK